MKNENSSGGVGATGLLSIALIVLKLCGVIDWPWFWVLSPILIPALISAACLIAFILYDAYKKAKDK